MMPSNDYPRHPVWNVFPEVLEHQILQACRLFPQFPISDDNLTKFVSVLTRKLALGCNQKELFRMMASCFGDLVYDAVVAELCSGLFAMEGVLSNMYQPLLSHRAAEAGDDALQRRQNVCK